VWERKTVETRGGRGIVLLIHGLWFRPSVWTPWLPELDEAGYDAVSLSWSASGFNSALRAAKRQAADCGSAPIVVGHGVGGAVAERLLTDGDAAAAISLAPVPCGYPAVPAAARLLGGKTRLALLSMRTAAVAPTFPQFQRAIANMSSNAEARRVYAEHVTTAPPRDVLWPAVRGRVPGRDGRRRRGPLLLAAGGKDELIREMSTAALLRNYRRGQPDAVTDYKVFPGLDHTLGLGSEAMSVLFYCLDWLTAQNM
jgi:pimeloyl-ACP methyl ester carboxylesterase